MSAAVMLLAGSTALSAISQYQSNKYNQKVSEQEADYQRKKAAFDEQRFRREAEISKGRMIATMNKSGRSFTSGSGLDLLSEQAGQDELDALIIRFGGQRNAAIAESKADMYGHQKIMQPLGTLLGGASAAAGMGAFGGGGLSMNSLPKNTLPQGSTAHLFR